VAHQAGAYPGFYSMRRIGVFLLHPGWVASLWQDYPPALNSQVPIYTPGWKESLWEWSVLPKNTTQCPRPRLEPRQLDPETSALTMRPPRLVNTLHSRLIAKAKHCLAMAEIRWGKWTQPKFLRVYISCNQGHIAKFYTNSSQSLHPFVLTSAIKTSLLHDCIF